MILWAVDAGAGADHKSLTQLFCLFVCFTLSLEFLFFFFVWQEIHIVLLM